MQTRADTKWIEVSTGQRAELHQRAARRTAEGEMRPGGRRVGFLAVLLLHPALCVRVRLARMLMFLPILRSDLSVSSKTKELVVDFRKQRTHLNSVAIRGTEVDIVDSYKYLGVHLDNKLDWTINTDAIYKKGQSCLFFLRRLRSFNVCRTMLQMFYHSVVSSVIFYAVVCWGSRLKTADTNRLNKLIRRSWICPGS
ncbi:hypothetical protein L3Q82_020227 [Scortum barcoo]|uniref:Uncharacterized protein n=1 Tax=Scortum barcoo TaxID=214431 RepID=A0ACB8V7J2_9TELE|nr:hypothetical protein L3Q82_020227 [Scortum barcoo]